MEIVVKRNESLIKSSVMKAVESDAIANVEAFGFVAAPWQNVRGDEQLADWEAGDGAAVGVVVEDDLTEVVLSSALLRGADGFSVPNWLALQEPDAVAGNDLSCFIFGFNEQGVELFLTERNNLRRIVVEFLPRLVVEVARPWQAHDATQF